MNQMIMDLPVIALRGLSILPNMIVHFEVSRNKSKRAIEAAMLKDQNIFLLTQKDPEVEDPRVADLYEFGTVAKIKQIVKLPKDSLRVMVEGTYRAHFDNLIMAEPMLKAEVSVYDKTLCEINDIQKAGYVRYLQEVLQNYAAQNPNFSNELVRKLLEEVDLIRLVDQLCTNLPMDYKQRQEFLECIDIEMRFEKLCQFMNREIEMIQITREIQTKVKERIDKNQREYFLREQLKVIKEELGEVVGEIVEEEVE